jgi:MerR family transcriptional regulator, redox-sensitive transcriptional activator SoxR
MSESLLSISEVAQAAGLHSSALRYYERAGLIRSKARQGGRRQFSPEVLQRLAVIALLQEVGFTIKEMATLFGRGGRQDRWRGLAENKLDEIDAHVKRVTQARELLASALACRCSSLDTCDLISARRGPHRKVIQTLSLRMGRPR